MLLFLNRSGVRTEHCLQAFAECLSWHTIIFRIGQDDRAVICPNEQMKMIGHEAISQHFASRQKVLPYFSQKKEIILALKKYRLEIVAAIINVKYVVFYELHCWVEVVDSVVNIVGLWN